MPTLDKSLLRVISGADMFCLIFSFFLNAIFLLNWRVASRLIIKYKSFRISFLKTTLLATLIFLLLVSCACPIKVIFFLTPSSCRLLPTYTYICLEIEFEMKSFLLISLNWKWPFWQHWYCTWLSCWPPWKIDRCTDWACTTFRLHALCKHHFTLMHCHKVDDNV